MANGCLDARCGRDRSCRVLASPGMKEQCTPGGLFHVCGSFFFANDGNDRNILCVRIGESRVALFSCSGWHSGADRVVGDNGGHVNWGGLELMSCRVKLGQRIGTMEVPW